MGNVGAIRTLVELGANVNFPDRKGWTPVYVASWEGLVGNYVDTIRAPAGHGGVVNAPDISGRIPLHIAAQGGHSKLIPALVELGGDVNAQDNDYNTPLHKL